jgi:hypothetical protein
MRMKRTMTRGKGGTTTWQQEDNEEEGEGPWGANDEGEGEDEADDGPRDIIDVSWAIGKF